jgi:mannan endo-1,4-beta-mannosidase
LTGVVVAVDDAGTLDCVPLCVETEHPDDPDTADDWAWEGYSCILPGSETANANQGCLTGQELPEPSRNGLPGLVVVTDDVGTRECVPVCTVATTSSDDSDWGWEFNASCILPGTWTAECEQACTTGSPLPAPEAREGVVIDDVCVALCACEKNPSTDAAFPDWSWEHNAECVVSGSESAAGSPACTTTETLSYVPPAVACSKVQDGFYTQGGRLYDACGNEFVIRGVNNPHIWFDTSNRYLAYGALDTIASYGANTIRVVWETTGSATLLAQVLYRIVQLDMVPMVELHDVTGASGTNDPLAMAQYYTGAEVRQVLTDFREYMLVNIANEWSGNDGSFVSAYQAAITELRGNGVPHTLVIDANAWGQNVQVLFDSHEALTSADPEGNLLFSVHMYGEYGSDAAVDEALDGARSRSMPIVVGEFGPSLSGTPVAWQRIMARCQELGIGYVGWSWAGNDGSSANLDMAADWTGPLTTWGADFMTGTNGLQSTSTTAGIF